jgi:hypothetical protein
VAFLAGKKKKDSRNHIACYRIIIIIIIIIIKIIKEVPEIRMPNVTEHHSLLTLTAKFFLSETEDVSDEKGVCVCV